MKRWGSVRTGLALCFLSGTVGGADRHAAQHEAPAHMEHTAPAHTQHAAPAPPVPMLRTQVATPAPDSVLTDQDGRRFAFRDLKGKAMLVSFVYTSCPDVCPVMFNVVIGVQQRLQAERHGDVVSVFVSTDPEIDSPQVLKSFAMRRGADLSATFLLTGKPDELRAVWTEFGVKVNRLGRGLVDHSPLTVLIDPQGVMRYRYLSGFPDGEIIAADVRKVLKHRTTKGR